MRGDRILIWSVVSYQATLLVHIHTKPLQNLAYETSPPIDGISSVEVPKITCDCCDFDFSRDDQESTGDVGLWVMG